MRRLVCVGFVVAVIVIAGFAFVSTRGVNADDSRSLSFLATDLRDRHAAQEGDGCSIARGEGPFTGWPLQVIVKDAAGIIVAKHDLLDGKGNSDGRCEVSFTIPYPDTPFATIYVDDERVTTLAESDLDALPADQPMNLFIQDM